MVRLVPDGAGYSTEPRPVYVQVAAARESVRLADRRLRASPGKAFETVHANPCYRQTKPVPLSQ